jgi:hypothetical protein
MRSRTAIAVGSQAYDSLRSIHTPPSNVQDAPPGVPDGLSSIENRTGASPGHALGLQPRLHLRGERRKRGGGWRAAFYSGRRQASVCVDFRHSAPTKAKERGESKRARRRMRPPTQIACGRARVCDFVVERSPRERSSFNCHELSRPRAERAFGHAHGQPVWCR